MKRFVDCAAVVTGGGSGIGEAVVRGLFAEDASVVVVDANQAAAQRVTDGLGAEGRAYCVALDVTDRARVDAVMTEPPTGSDGSTFS